MILSYTRTGQGHPLVILHGLYGSGENWLTIARGLSSICEVFLVDQRNHGKSFHSDIHDYPSMVNDISLLMNELGIEKATILGHSMGGRTAMRFAAIEPPRISRLIIADVSPRSYTDPTLDRGYYHFHSQILDTLATVKLAGINGIGAVDDQLARVLPDKRLRQFLLKNLDRSTEGTFRWKLNIPAIKANLDKLNAGMEDIINTGATFVQYPVLFIRGNHSDYIREADVRIIRLLYPHSQVVTIKNAGHWLHADQPATFISAVKNFLLT